MLTLDVGCGHKPEGNINIDLYLEATAHRSLEADMRSNTDCKLEGIPNLLKADCYFLPFRSNIFDKTVSNHVIEHIEEPLHLLKEMVRVTIPNGYIKITTPHKLSHKRKWILHKHSFNLSWFAKAFKVLGVEMVNSERTFRCIPHDYFPLFRVPYFIQVTGKVKKNE